jgi:hypothetical protein
MMLIATGGFIVINSLLLASFAAGAFQIWQLYAATLCVSLFGALARPAFMASVATLVPDSQRDRANAFGQLSGSTAGVIAPAAAGLLYALIGVVGSIAINIAAFFVGLAVLLIVRIPTPVQTADGRAMQSSMLRQMFDGFRYLWARRALFWFCGYISVVNLVANTVMVLLTPYALTRTGSATLMGAVLAAMNGGGIAGSLAISAGAKFGSRMNTVMIGLVSASVFMSLVGVAEGAVTIGASLFLMMFALSFNNAPFWSMLQTKIAPDLQGRVFAAYLQGVMLMSPIAFVIAGPLADRVFEPARRLPVWRGVGWLVGSGPGAGMGLMFVVAGVLILLLSLAMYAVPAVRRLESDLPDHAAAAEVPAA